MPSGGRHTSRHKPRSGACGRGQGQNQKGRLPHARPPHEGAQKVRIAQGEKSAAVLQEIIVAFRAQTSKFKPPISSAKTAVFLGQLTKAAIRFNVALKKSAISNYSISEGEIFKFEPNLILVEKTDKNTIIDILIKLNELNYFSELNPVDLKEIYKTYFTDLQDLNNWVRVY